MEASTSPALGAHRIARWIVAPLAVGLATAFNLVVPSLAQVAPYVAFHLAAPVVAWFTRSLPWAWASVLASAVLGNLVSMEPRWQLTTSPGALGAGLAFILVQAAFALSVILLRRRMEDRELLHQLSEAGLLGIGSWTGTRIVSANRRLLEILGHSPESGIPEGGIDAGVITPPELAEIGARGLAELETSGCAALFEKQLLRPDGARVWILGGATLLEREPPGGVAFVLDITAQKEAERALQEAHQFEQRVLGIVSHDLRNPLASIRLGVDLLLRTGSSDLQLRTATRMARSAERMHQLIAGLLDVTQLRARQQLPIRRGPSNMNLLVARAVEEVSVADPGRIRVTEHGEGSGEWDSVRLGQALGNLLGNALQHSPAGSPVTVHVEGRPETVQVSIHNGGEPIPPEQQQTLFEPFRRGDNPAVDGSLGLGLYIAWHVTRAHGGTIEVSSSAENGTTFRLTVPRWAAPAQSPSRPTSADPLAPALVDS